MQFYMHTRKDIKSKIYFIVIKIQRYFLLSKFCGIKIISTFVKNTSITFLICKSGNKKGKKQGLVMDNSNPARLKIKEYLPPRKKTSTAKTSEKKRIKNSKQEQDFPVPVVFCIL